MQNRRLVYLLLVAALIFAASIFLLMYNINSARLQFQKTQPGAYNYLLQADRAFDRFDDALIAYEIATNPDERQAALKQLKIRFDIIWSTFRVFEIGLPSQSIAVDASNLGDDVKSFLAQYDTTFNGEQPLTINVQTAAQEEIQELSNRLYELGLEVFTESNALRDSIATHIDELYRYFWIFGLLLILTGTLLITQLFRLNNSATRLVREARKSEEQLGRVVEELRSGKQEQKAKDSFLAAASHDLRQPLHALGLFVSALENKVKAPDGPAILEKIKQSTEALNSLFNSLLDISRLDAGVVESTPQHFYIGELLRSLTEEFREVAAQRNLAITIDHSDDVAYTDYVLLGRILRNLIGNAVVHTREGEITVSCKRRGSHLRMRVADTGPGIPTDEHDSVFSEYYQLNNPERDRSKGLGLGLSIVRRLSDLLGLKVSLQSVVGEGTVFELQVPAGAPDQVVTRSAPSIAQTGVDFQGALVLVIDDEQDVRDGMELMLQQVNCTVLTAESEQVAQQMVVERDLVPTLIIADYRLREGKTGDQAIALIRDELNIDIPALIITGDTSPERVREAANSGTRLLHKPVIAMDLVTAVQALLLESQAASDLAS
ncbi:MAG: hybrid sensor histidine kinase/response regulator [Gammaproteobacteria bacterium]|nr:hybrid sensor histidine kinase/response regulator [Gammaproteobacteria bacterium]